MLLRQAFDRGSVSTTLGGSQQSSAHSPQAEARDTLELAARVGNTSALASALATQLRTLPRQQQRDVLARCLVTVCRAGFAGCVELLLAANANPNAVAALEESALHAAAWAGATRCITMLLGAGASMRLLNHRRATPLFVAAAMGKQDALAKLIDAGAEPDAPDGQLRTPLFIAAENGHRDCVELLLAAGANASSGNRHGTTPLHVACEGGYGECVTALLKAGANVNAPGFRQQPPLMAAVRNGHVNCAAALLAAGADIDASNMFQETSLCEAMVRGHIPCVRLLLESGASVDCRNGEGETVFHMAARGDNKAGLKLLLRRLRPGAAAGLDTVAAATGRTPLLVTIHEGFEDCFNLLLRAGANPNVGENRYGAMYIAVARQHLWAVSGLLAAGGDVSTKAVALAMHGGRTKCTEMLLQATSDMEFEEAVTEGLALADEPATHPCIGVVQRSSRWRRRRPLALIREQRRAVRDAKSAKLVWKHATAGDG